MNYCPIHQARSDARVDITRENFKAALRATFAEHPTMTISQACYLANQRQPTRILEVESAWHQMRATGEIQITNAWRAGSAVYRRDHRV